MSYLDRPRLYFSGSFKADPSTFNNDPKNFNMTPRGGQAPPINPDWNGGGSHFWQFHGCRVEAVAYLDGTTADDPAKDPVLGCPILSADSPAPGKLVDLDTDNQGVSEIWGLNVQLGTDQDANSFAGAFKVAAFDDLWFARSTTGSGDSAASAYYQSLLKKVQWGSSITSRFLKELKETSAEHLSIKFVADGFQPDATNPRFTFGRVVGCIGPAFDGEPAHFVPARFVGPVGFQTATSPLPQNFAPCKVDGKRKTAIFDLGNSLQTNAPGGGMINLGNLQAAILVPNNPVLLGNVHYLEGQYERTALIQEFALTDAQLSQAASNPLGVVQVDAATGNPTPILQENSDGIYVRADQFVFRMNPGDKKEVHLTAMQYGAPKAGFEIDLALYPGAFPPNIGNNPSGALNFPSSVTTDQNGRASFTMSASDPGNPRGFIDGQVYAVRYTWNGNAQEFSDPNDFVSVLVFDSYPQNANPSWQDIAPILTQYARLYPYMYSQVKLDEYAIVSSDAAAMIGVLSLSEHDPRYMPVTRDLSRDKKDLLLTWLKNLAND